MILGTCYGCLNIFAISCDIYGDVWKVHQTNVTDPSEKGGGVASLKITLHVSQQDALHIPKHTSLQGAPNGTLTPSQGVPRGMGNCHMLSGHTIDVTRCVCHRGDKVRLGQVCFVDASQLGLQSSRGGPRGRK